MSGAGRGHWDRQQSREARRNTAHAALIEAARRASREHGGAVTVGHVVALAGVGRNTFYAHFRDLSEALAAAEDEATDASEKALLEAARAARTPIERIRAVARAWLELSGEEPSPAGMPPWSRREAGRLERTLRDVLVDAKNAGVVGRAPDAARVRCLMGAFVAAGLDGGPRSALERDETAEMLVDFTLRVFR